MTLKTYHRILLEKQLKKIAPGFQGSILDAGAGSRRYDQLFRGKISACDLKAQPELGVEKCDISALPYSDNRFDNVLCLEVLQYLTLTEIVQALSEIKRVLRSGGSAVLTIPLYYKDHQDKVRFCLNYFQALLTSAGFTEVKVKKIGNQYTALYDMLRYGFFAHCFLKPFYLLIMAFLFFMIKVLHQEQKQDEFYTGLFAVVKK